MDYIITKQPEDILHLGVAHDANPPGRGSGRYAYGSMNNTQRKILTTSYNTLSTAAITTLGLGIIDGYLAITNPIAAATVLSASISAGLVVAVKQAIRNSSDRIVE